MSDHILVATLKYIAVEIIWDVIYFPIWWYSKGLMGIINYCLESATFHVNRRMALGIWMKNMFKPMYGDYTREGRIISIFMRFFVLIWKMIGTVLWLVFLFVIFILWIILPLLIIYFILYQIFDVPLFFINEL
ncbi:MAG: hypothetical protein Q8P20_10065 [bacterium]|nr:hypothetical protein [bacterium]